MVECVCGLACKKSWSVFLRSILPFCLPPVHTDVISEKTATTPVRRNHVLCSFLKPASQSHASVCVSTPLTHKRLFFRVPQWDLFSGPYWKYYHRKRIASEPAMLDFPACFLLCLWFSLDLLQLWFILIFCSGIYCLSLHVPCVLLSVTSLSCGIVLRWHPGFCHLLFVFWAHGTGCPGLGQRQILTWHLLDLGFLPPFPVTVAFLNLKKYENPRSSGFEQCFIYRSQTDFSI